MTPDSVGSKRKSDVPPATSPPAKKTPPAPIRLVPSYFHQPKARKPLSYKPRVSSLLADPQRPKPAGDGARTSKSKCFVEVSLKEASQSPFLTTSATHSYRYTRNGIELFAMEGKELLAHRIDPNNVSLPLWGPHEIEEYEDFDELSTD